MTERKVIGVDLDGTLADYSNGFQGEEIIGAPIPKMVERVKAWIAEGHKVIIFTARVSTYDDRVVNGYAKYWVEKWLEENGLGGLEITNVKRIDMVEFWDDRAVQVIPNTGEALQELAEDLLDKEAK